MTTNQIFIKNLAKMRAHKAKTRALPMPYKDSDPRQKKSRKCVFWPFLNRHQKKLFYSLLLIRQKYYESSKTEYSDSPSFINRLSLFLYKKSTKNVQKSAKNWPPDPPDPPEPIFLARGIVLILTHAKEIHNFALWG